MPRYQDKFENVLVPFLGNSKAMKDTARESFGQAMKAHKDVKVIQERRARFVTGFSIVGALLGGNVGCMVAGLSVTIVSFLVSLRDSPYHEIIETLNALGYKEKEQLINELERLLQCEGCSKDKFSARLYSAEKIPKGREKIWKLCLESLSYYFTQSESESESEWESE
ncbi:unnamed protein product [Pseudo-nitzschia multistriata]|uniref:Uncharacterized protein n=1 Tax=Pseudo-nitzschia multistriata TaxID=183589 RepID=A0A448ZGI6_9STRA|nr:unnamed protein product [Pseudo-nitzschia multistriata]